MKEIKLGGTIHFYETYGSFSEQEKTLFQCAKNACQRAYAPYSKFKVGAAVLLTNGEILEGNNQENASFPVGLCAERVALFYASSKFPEITVQSIAITIDFATHPDAHIISPCGSCRQAISEYEQKFQNDIKIYLLGQDEKVWIANSIKILLPLSFNGDILK